ncbi:hypothetical protein DPV78_007205 [Talaromyces pinophilus]|nr:hypothetical protein DPV78_007205 [Talaromyces pinophilus]
MAIQRYLLTILASLVLVPPVIGAICDSTISDVIGIASQADADDIASCGSANADIEISEDYTGALILNGITKTTRSLIFQGVTNLTSFAAPDLLVIDGNLTLASCILLTDLTLGELNFVGDMKLEDLPNLQSLNFTSGMRTVSGISIVNTGLTTLDGLEISSASDGINIPANTALTDITFPSLTNTSIFSIHANNPKMKVNLPSLAAVQDLTIENVTSLSIPGLYQVTGQLLIAGSSIDSFSTGPLKNGGGILFIDNPFLSNISMPDLTSLSGDLVITGNEALQQITGFTGLADVHGNIDVTGNYTGFALPWLMAVNGSFDATSQSDFGGCATFDELKQDNVIQGAYTCSPPGASSSSPTSSIFPETTSTPPSGDSSSPLSTGAKVAIGVCVPVAITALSALLFFWWRRRRSNANGRNVHDELTPRPELAGSPVATRLSHRSELDARHTKITRDSTILEPVELPNDSESNVYHEMPDAPRDTETHS